MARPLKIALVRRDYTRKKGGAENYFAALAGALRDFGHEVHLFVNTSDIESSDNLVIHKVPMMKFVSELRVYSFAQNAERILRRRHEEFDIVNGLSKIWFQDVYRMSDPLYRHWIKIHPTSLIDTVAGFLNPRHRVPLHMEKLLFNPRNFRRIIAISELDRRLVKACYHVPSERIRVIYNGVDHSRFNPSLRNGPRSRIRGKYGFEDDRVVFLFAAMDWKRKGLSYALDALARMDEKAKKCLSLLVVGRGDRKKYENTARKLGVADLVTWEGPVGNIEEYYGAADAFIFPTIYDPFANVHLEALASGLPVITTAMAGGAEIVQPGENGYVIESADDTDDLAGKMTMLMHDSLRIKMGGNASKSVAGFTVERNARETLDLYYEILEEKRRNPRQGYYRRG